MSTGNPSLDRNLNELAYKVINTTTWGPGETTCTISDPYVVSNSFPIVIATGSTAPSGRWAITTIPTSNAGGVLTPGSIVITSSDSEQSTLPISYILL